MDGVNILYQSEITTTPFWVVIVGIVLFYTAIFAFIEGIKSRSCPVKLIAFIIAGVSIGVLITIANTSLCIPTDRYHYEATIDDDVTFTELYEKYEIIEQKGEIYILKDKPERGKE